MLSYRHAFHAGNHADILKHSVLVNIFESLIQKEKPFSVLDTHAGSGLYFFDDERSQKTKEADKGIIELLKKMDNLDFPDSLLAYYKITSLYKKHGMYPGSVEFEKIYCDEKCLHFVSELNNSEIDILRKNAKEEPLVLCSKEKSQVKTQVILRDGFEAACALTPPEIKRGLMLIDPSYEDKIEYKKVSDTVIKVHKKWPAAIIAVWYPLLAHRTAEIELLKTNIRAFVKTQNPNTEILNAEFLVNKEDSHIETSLKENDGPPRLYGSGMLVVNAPWKLDQKTGENLKYISKAIYADGSTDYRITLS